MLNSAWNPQTPSLPISGGSFYGCVVPLTGRFEIWMQVYPGSGDDS